MGRYADVDTDVKPHLGITDASHDTELATALAAAEELVDRWCGRTFDAVDPNADSSESRLFDGFGASRIDVGDVVQVDTVDTRTSPSASWDTVDSDLYEMLPHNAAGISKPYTILRAYQKLHGVVRVTGWFGWPTTPDVVKQAVVLQTSRYYSRRGATLGVQTVVSTEGSGMRLMDRLDADVEMMLRSVRKIAVF